MAGGGTFRLLHISPAWPVLPLPLMYERPERRLVTCGWLAMSDLEVDETQLEMAQRHVRETEVAPENWTGC